MFRNYTLSSEKMIEVESNNEVMEQIEDIDMFADSPVEMEPSAKKIKVKNEIVKAIPLQDNWDDEEGYYKVTIGEVLQERYQVFATLGKGVFSTVVKANDKVENTQVAIKIIRSNDTMRKLGHKEIDILKKLNDNDPSDKKHVVRMITHFEYRKHLCIVFESLSINLRQVLKKYGRDVGISVKAVRAYAKQLVLSLCLLDKCRIVHADIKPDNILVTENHNKLKLCDLGSASSIEDNEITPYLVSRFYRAPEIILGLSYDNAVDMWSLGCTLFEIFTGKILFPGDTNNHMLKLMMDVKGRFSNKMIKRGQFNERHFDKDFNFLYNDKESNTVKSINLPKQKHTVLKERVLKLTKPDDEDYKMVVDFVNFLERCLSLNPEHRLKPRDALEHPFLN
ncbi:kinase-like protein [Neoconidiobolus thromboides FSU 785]|nr:kinase-like protein [Neoconidiobolus thromboides FSU 785]